MDIGLIVTITVFSAIGIILYISFVTTDIENQCQEHLMYDYDNSTTKCVKANDPFFIDMSDWHIWRAH